VDLSGQTVTFYQTLHGDPALAPYQAGSEDAIAYFNGHGGICGATLVGEYFQDANMTYLRTREPKPVLITAEYSMELRDDLAREQIPAFTRFGAKYDPLYGEDGTSPGWIFMPFNSVYQDQVGAFCEYVAANKESYPDPRVGYMTFGGEFSKYALPEASSYCERLGIGSVGRASADGASGQVQAALRELVDAGANVIYSGIISRNLEGLASTSFAQALAEMGLHDTVTLFATSSAFDPVIGLQAQLDMDVDGVPLLDGMIGSYANRSWYEADHPCIRLITEQADLNNRPLTMRTHDYIRAWVYIDLFIETYIRTGNRVGFGEVSGAEMKKTLDEMVYAPLGGVVQVDFRDGRRALSSNRIGVMHFLGQDGANPAGPDNPPIVQAVDGEDYFVPILVPLTDIQPAPDLRPGGADVP
jgi:hypothetical protein